MPLFCFCLLFSVVYRFCHGTPLVYCYFICIYLQLHATITNYHSSTQLHQQTTMHKNTQTHTHSHYRVWHFHTLRKIKTWNLLMTLQKPYKFIQNVLLPGVTLKSRSTEKHRKSKKGMRCSLNYKQSQREQGGGWRGGGRQKLAMTETSISGQWCWTRWWEGR